MIFSSLTILLQKVFSFSAISVLDEMILPHVIKQRNVFIRSHFFRENGFNYFPKIFIFINDLAIKFVIMSFLAFLTSFTQRLRCALFAFLYSSGLQRRNLFLNFDLVIISFFLQKRILIYPGIFLFFWEHDSLVTFYMHQRNQSVYKKPQIPINLKMFYWNFLVFS